MFIECISGKLRERDQLEDTGLDGQIILKWIFERLYILGPEMTPLGSFCEQGDVHIGPKKASCVSTTLLACGFHVLNRNSKRRSVLQGKYKHPGNSKWQYPVPGRFEAMHSRDWGQWSHVS